MANELAQINFASEVTDKVRQLIMNAMPEEKLQKVLNDEYKSYFEGETAWNCATRPSKFAELVKHEVQKFMAERVAQDVRLYLSKLMPEGSESAKIVLEEITPIVIKAMAQDTARNVAATFVNNIIQNNNNNRIY